MIRRQYWDHKTSLNTICRIHHNTCSDILVTDDHDSSATSDVAWYFTEHKVSCACSLHGYKRGYITAVEPVEKVACETEVDNVVPRSLRTHVTQTVHMPRCIRSTKYAVSS